MLKVIDVDKLICQVEYFSARVLLFSQFSDCLDCEDIKLIDFGNLDNIIFCFQGSGCQCTDCIFLITSLCG